MFTRPRISEEFLQAAGVHLVEEPEPRWEIPYHDARESGPGIRRGLVEVRPDGQKYDQPQAAVIQVYSVICVGNFPASF